MLRRVPPSEARGGATCFSPWGLHFKNTNDIYGISLDEMVVPAALLKKITKLRIEIVLDKIPDLIEGLEDAEIQLELLIRNNGNKEAKYFLSAELDTGWKETLVGSVASLEEKSIILHIPTHSGH